MAVKTFYYSQLSNLMVEGVGIHASFSINLTVKDENIPSGKKIYISATGKCNAAKAAGSGSILFWCKIKNTLNNTTHNLDRKRGEYFAMGFDDILIGSTEFQIQNKSLTSPRIEMEAGYFYDSGYTGAIPPFPGSMKKTIILTPFGR